MHDEAATREALLVRKLATLYPDPERHRTARALLDGYGAAAHHREPQRVRLAVLKLAGADLASLRRHVELAGQDYRDVLAWAEYPEQVRRHSHALARSERERLIAADRAQYRAWLET